MKATELRSDDRRALIALESLYEETNDAPALLDILKRRAEAAEDDAERKALLFKEARLCDETLADPRAAIAVYEQIVEIALDPAALSIARAPLYGDRERWDDLMALYERQIDMEAGTAPEKKAHLHHALGVVLEKRMRDLDRAFDEYQAALTLEAQHKDTVSSLEGILEGGGASGARAAGDARRRSISHGSTGVA